MNPFHPLITTLTLTTFALVMMLIVGVMCVVVFQIGRHR